MQEDHVPPLGMRYWSLFLAVGALSSVSGDLLAENPVFGVVGDGFVLVVALAAIFIGERYDKSPTDLWYWMAVIVIQVGAEMLVERSIDALGLSRGVVFASFAAVLVVILVGARSSATVLISAHLISRPGAAAKPMNDAAHWAAMIVASTLGTVTGDYFMLGLGVGAFSSVVVLIGLAVSILGLWLVPWANRLFVYWLTIAAVCAAGSILGAFLSKASVLANGGPLSAVLASVLVASLLLWRPSPPC